MQRIMTQAVMILSVMTKVANQYECESCYNVANMSRVDRKVPIFVFSNLSYCLSFNFNDLFSHLTSHLTILKQVAHKSQRVCLYTVAVASRDPPPITISYLGSG